MTLRQNHPFPNNCEPDNFKADETAICGDEKPLSFDSEYHWTRYTCEKTAGQLGSDCSDVDQFWCESPNLANLSL